MMFAVFQPLRATDVHLVTEPGNLSPVIERLVTETGISLEQARELVSMLGANWSSLVREARLLRGARQREARDP